MNKPGTAYASAISTAQKQLKDSKCQVFFTVPEKPKSWTKLARWKGGRFRIF